MMMNDPLGDMLTRIRNKVKSRKQIWILIIINIR